MIPEVARLVEDVAVACKVLERSNRIEPHLACKECARVLRERLRAVDEADKGVMTTDAKGGEYQVVTLPDYRAMWEKLKAWAQEGLKIEEEPIRWACEGVVHMMSEIEKGKGT